MTSFLLVVIVHRLLVVRVDRLEMRSEREFDVYYLYFVSFGRLSTADRAGRWCAGNNITTHDLPGSVTTCDDLTRSVTTLHDGSRHVTTPCTPFVREELTTRHDLSRSVTICHDA